MSKYFASSSSKRGELHEWKEELHAREKSTQKEAVKKVIAAMTVGKDVSSLFPDVVQCMQSSSIELKKLVYLYIVNYAKAQPELAILAVNTFRKDASDPNPLIRALAVRTMSCIKLPAILEYLLEPLRRACVDSDPYVRKTAAVCVAKIHQMDPAVCQEQGLLEALLDMISDANPVVVCNAVSSIMEISESLITLDTSTVQRLLAALNEATEWGQVALLDALSAAPVAASLAPELVLERVFPRLNHSNPAVVLSAVKVVLRFSAASGSRGSGGGAISGKLAAPLVSLMAAEPEMQYVALRAVNLVSQRHPEILRAHVKTFFVKYNDPVYVKLEKLELLVLLVEETNVELVLQECREYALGEIDMEFVRRAIRSIGQVAIKLSSAAVASQAVQVLFELITAAADSATRSYVLEEAAIVIRDVFRKFSLAFEAVLTTLCANLAKIEAPEGKSAVIFILGEYAEFIANADEIFMAYCEYFSYESSLVQLALLTAAVKLFLKVPGRGQRVVTHVLKLCTAPDTSAVSAVSADLRERAYLYWRMLSSDPELCKLVALSDKPVIKFESVLLDKDLLQKLLAQLGNLSSVLHKLPAQFLRRAGAAGDAGAGAGDLENEENAVERAARLEKLKAATERALRGEAGESAAGHGADGLSEYSGDEADNSPASQRRAPGTASAMAADLLDLDLSPSSNSNSNSARGGGAETGLTTVVARTSAGANTRTSGVEVAAALQTAQQTTGGEAEAAGLRLKLRIENFCTGGGGQELSGFAIQFNKNFFGLSPASSAAATLATLGPVKSGEAVQTEVPVAFNAAMVNAEKTPSFPLVLQVALKTSVDVYYFSVPVAVADVLKKHSFQAELGHGNSVQALASSRHWSGEALGQALSSLGLAFAGMEDTVALFGAKTVSGLPVAVRVHLGDPLRVDVASANSLLTAFLHEVLSRTLV